MTGFPTTIHAGARLTILSDPARAAVVILDPEGIVRMLRREDALRFLTQFIELRAAAEVAGLDLDAALEQSWRLGLQTLAAGASR